MNVSVRITAKARSVYSTFKYTDSIYEMRTHPVRFKHFTLRYARISLYARERVICEHCTVQRDVLFTYAKDLSHWSRCELIRVAKYREHIVGPKETAEASF